MRCSSAGSICHSPFSSFSTEIFPALIARRIAVLFRPTAAAAVAMVYMGCLPTDLVSSYGATDLVKKTYLGADYGFTAPAEAACVMPGIDLLVFRLGTDAA